jgi:hypothetical protein
MAQKDCIDLPEAFRLDRRLGQLDRAGAITEEIVSACRIKDRVGQEAE